MVAWAALPSGFKQHVLCCHHAVMVSHEHCVYSSTIYRLAQKIGTHFSVLLNFTKY